jgi:gluconate 5-dehydrogenase
MELFNLKNKVAVVTGGNGHLGTAITRILSANGATVIVADTSEDRFKEVYAETGNNIIFKLTDVTNSEIINNVINEVLDSHGSIDILINNAHAVKGNSQEEMNDEEWAFTMDAVLGSVYKCTKAVLPFMKKQKSGKIINIASMYGLVSPDFSLYKGDDCEKYTNPPHYGAAKAGIVQLTKYFAVLLGPYNIHINAIAPGPFPNEFIQKQNSLFIERLKKKNPLNRIGKPEDIAGTILLLSSGASDFITGQTIQIDGGWTIW